MSVPYIFANTPNGTKIPLSHLDADFAYVDNRTQGLIDNLPIKIVNTIANLRSMAVDPAYNIEVGGYYADGDGGGGYFYAATTGGPYTDNGGTIIVPGGGTASSAWIRAYSGSLSVLVFGADKSGATDSTAEIQAAIASLSATGGNIVFPQGTYNISSAITLYSNIQIIGEGRPTINVTVAGQNIFSAASRSKITIRNLNFNGTGSSTVPLNSVGGQAPTSTSLITFVSCSDVTISECEVSNFYSTITLINCLRCQVTNNYIHNWLVYGVLGSGSDQLSVDYNSIIGCDQTGAENAYGVMITGSFPSNPSTANSISFNRIWDIPSWDGIMTHDMEGLKIIGNDIRNVRMGIDLSAFTATFIDNLQVSDNYIKATTINTWGGSAANHFGILCQGESGVGNIGSAIVTGNIVDGFFGISGASFTGNPSNIVAGASNEIVIANNIIKNAGSVNTGFAGVYIISGATNVAVSGNNISGTMNAGGIRFASATIDEVNISGNIIDQNSSSDLGIFISNSTIGILNSQGNSTNSTTPFSTSSSTITRQSVNNGSIVSVQSCTVTALASGSATSVDFTVSGVTSADTAIAYVPTLASSAGVFYSAYCTVSNTVRVFILNMTGSPLTFTSNMKIVVMKYA